MAVSRRRAGAVAVPVSSSSDEEEDIEGKQALGSHTFRHFFKLAWIGEDLDKCSLKDAVQKRMSTKVQQIIDSSIDDDIHHQIRAHFLLHEAVERNSPAILLSLLSKSTPELLYQKNFEGKTPLHVAVEAKGLNCFDYLVKADRNTLIQQDNEGNTPLHYIARSKYTGACDIAMKYATAKDINTINKSNHSAVHVSVRENNEIMLRYCIEKGASIEGKTKHGYTPLHFAADGGFNRCVELLIKYIPADKRKDYMNAQTQDLSTALILATKKGFSACCRLLNETDANIKDKTGLSALHYAAMKGYLTIVRYLVEDLNADINIKNRKQETPLYFASMCFNDEPLQYLLERCQEIQNPEALLRVATEKNCRRTLSVLLNHAQIKPYIDHQFPGNEDTLLHISLRKGYYKITKILLDHQANKDIKNKQFNYPLHLAAAQRSLESRSAEEERLEICKEILRESHNLVNMINVNHESPLHLACESGNEEMIRSVLKKGSKALAANSDGLTAIHIAAKKGHESCVKLVLKALNNAQRKEVSKSKPHPLHLAAEFGHLNCSAYLLSEFKDALSARDNNDLFPVDLAFKRKKVDVFRFLLLEMRYDQTLLEFSCRLHNYFEKSLKEKRIMMLEAIIESQWCHVVFDGYYCSRLRQPVMDFNEKLNGNTFVKDDAPIHENVEHCPTFGLLIKHYPSLACKAMDQHITSFPDHEIFNYTPFEFIYYNTQGGTIYPVFGSSDMTYGTQLSVNEDSVFLTSGRTTPTSLISPTPPATPMSLQSSTRRLFRKQKTVSTTTEHTRPNSIVTVQNVSDSLRCKTRENKKYPLLKKHSESVDYHRIAPEAREFKGAHWGTDHPLLQASHLGCTEVLSHRLVKSWLENKFINYARVYLYTYVALDILTAIVATVAFAYKWSPHLLLSTYNVSREAVVKVYSDIHWPPDNFGQNVTTVVNNITENLKNNRNNCNGLNYSSYDGMGLEKLVGEESTTQTVQDWLVTACVVQRLSWNTPYICLCDSILLLLTLMHFFLEFLFAFRVGIKSNKSFSILRLSKTLTLPLIIIFTCTCDFLLGTKQELLWQLGVFTVLLTWVNIVSSINRVPEFSVFMPITRQFVWNYLKVITHVIIILFAFALCFHFLLYVEEPAFHTVPYSLIKTLVWMLGDLGYNDTFLQDDAPLRYPVQANILFVMFVTTIGGLVFNLILRDPADQLQEIKERSGFHQADSTLKLHLLIDRICPSHRRKYARKQKTFYHKNLECGKSSIFYTRLSERVTRSAGSMSRDYDCIHNNERIEKQGENVEEMLKELLKNFQSLKEDVGELSKKISNSNLGKP